MAKKAWDRWNSRNTRNTWDTWNSWNTDSLLNVMIAIVRSIGSLRRVTICNKMYYKLIQIMNYGIKIEPFCDRNSHISIIYVSY